MKVFKLIRTAGAAAAVLAFASGACAQALLSSSSVSVKVTLTSQCRLTTSPLPALVVDFGTYTAFSSSAVTATPTTFAVECTRGFGTSPTVAWDGGTNAGVISGLQYALSLTGATPVPGTAASTSTIGTGDAITFTLGGTMPALQAGTNSTGQQTAPRTVTLTF